MAAGRNIRHRVGAAEENGETIPTARRAPLPRRAVVPAPGPVALTHAAEALERGGGTADIDASEYLEIIEALN